MHLRHSPLVHLTAYRDLACYSIVTVGICAIECLCGRVLMPAGPDQDQVLKTVLTAPIPSDAPISTIHIVSYTGRLPSRCSLLLLLPTNHASLHTAHYKLHFAAV